MNEKLNELGGVESRRTFLERIVGVGAIASVVNVVDELEASPGYNNAIERKNHLVFNVLEMVVDKRGYVWYLPKFKDPENADATPLSLLVEEREDFDLKMHSISCLKGEILRDIPNGKWDVFDTVVFNTPEGNKTMRVVGWKTSKKAS